MLGLGIGDENAHAHNVYRQKYGKYELIWVEDPETDERTQGLKRRLTADRTIRQGVQTAIRSPLAEPRPVKHDEEIAADLAATGELTAELVRGGAKERKAEQRSERSNNQGAERGSIDAGRDTSVPHRKRYHTTPEPEPENPPAPTRDKPPTLGGFF